MDLCDLEIPTLFIALKWTRSNLLMSRHLTVFFLPSGGWLFLTVGMTVAVILHVLQCLPPSHETE